MKKYSFLFLFAACLFACDYNARNFDDLNDLSAVKNVYAGEYTVTAADYPAIVNAATASGDAQVALWAQALNRDKIFSAEAPAEMLLPYLLKAKFNGVDAGSRVNVAYNYLESRNEAVSNLTGASRRLTDDDYRLAWGEPSVAAFTPAKTPEQWLPQILAANIAEPADGAYANVEYYVSADEPVTATVESVALAEDFETYTINENIGKGWTQFNEAGAYKWQAKQYNSNFYAQGNNSSTGQQVVWLVSPEIDLTEYSNPVFSFDVKVGNWKADCLDVYLSTDFDGNEVLSATWQKVTDHFTLPQTPTSGYGDNSFTHAGNYSLSEYRGAKIHVAFRYNGDAATDPPRNTTYHLDNVKVAESVTGMEVAEKSLVYAAYRYDGEGAHWVKATNILSLQPADYAVMGLTYLTVEQAPSYLPAWLLAKYPFAQDGDTRTVAYKTAAQSVAADRFLFADGRWVAESVRTTKTGQFILSQKGWIFDPTVVITFTKADYQTIVDYVIAHQAVETPALVHKNANAEYYYGFAAYYSNLSYRETERKLDPTYPLDGTVAEKTAFMDARAIEGLAAYLATTRPDLLPDVNGVPQYAKITLIIFADPSSNRQNVTWTYTLQCTAPGLWAFVEREEK